MQELQSLVKDALDGKHEYRLLKDNRGGFFGAYKTYGRILNAVGFYHFSYTNSNGIERTAESTTDHLLMKLYDEVSEAVQFGVSKGL